MFWITNLKYLDVHIKKNNQYSLNHYLLRVIKHVELSGPCSTAVVGWGSAVVAAEIWCSYEYFSHICQGDEQVPFWVFSLIVGPKVPRAWSHQPHPTLSSLWAAPEGLHTGPWDGLHKVVGDLPLVLKQVFNFCTVCITYEEKKGT